MQFKLPELGEGVHEGELIQWKVKVGDPVRYDQPLCEIMTDKATIEIPSAVQGKVGQLHVQPGALVQVGQLMLSFAETQAVAADVQVGSTPVLSTSASPSSVPVAPRADTCSLSEEKIRVLAAPSTRRLAREKGVELSQIQGSGPHGRVLREDVIGLKEKPSLGIPAKERLRDAQSEERVPFLGLRKKIAEKMRLSKDHAAHFTYVEEADATALVQLRNQAKEIASQQGIKITYLPFVMKAMVATLKQFPILNASLDETQQQLVYHRDYHISLSVQTEDGLTAPVIRDVEHRSILELAQDIQAVVERARTKRLTREDLQGGTITLTNAGSIGGLFTTPIINYPEVAILGFNKIARKPVVQKVGDREEILIRDWTYFSLSLDHRVVDGAIAAEFMKKFIRYIENPSLLLLGGGSL